MPFQTEKLTLDNGIKIGSNKAPIKVIEFVNWRCPDARNYQLDIAMSLNKYIEQGHVQRIIKHFDKHKGLLEKGNILNQYIDYGKPDEAYQLIEQIYQKQNEWGNLDFQDIPHFAESLNLSLQANNKDLAKAVQAEIDAVGIEFVPTIFVNDQAFVETFSKEVFIQAVESNLV